MGKMDIASKVNTKCVGWRFKSNPLPAKVVVQFQICNQKKAKLNLLLLKGQFGTMLIMMQFWFPDYYHFNSKFIYMTTSC